MSPEQIRSKPVATPQEQPPVTGSPVSIPETEEVLAKIKTALVASRQKKKEKVVEKKSRCGCW